MKSDQVVTLIRIEGQSRKPFDYRLSDFITAYTIDNSRSQTPDSKAKAEKEARDLAERLFERGKKIEEAVQIVIDAMPDDTDDIPVPSDLVDQVKQKLKDEPELRWDQAVAKIAGASQPDILLDDEKRE
jgi:hypothetical protein